MLKGHSGSVLSLIVGANNRLYYGSGDTTIKVWDIETLQCLQTLHGHSSVVMSVIYWFEALAEGLKSKYAELCSAFFVSATWLVHMLTVLPDTGIQGAARVCLLKRFVSTFKSTKDTEDRALSMLALNSFIGDPEGLRDLTSYMKDLLKGLRELKKSSIVALEMLKVFSEGNDSRDVES